jgi:hypothetical protein
LKSQKDEPLVYGHKYSWLIRLVQRGTSWVAPQDTLRIDPELSDSQVGSQQVKELAERNRQSKVVVQDSLYGNHIFLAVFLLLQNTFALVRMRSNNVLYEQPAPRKPGKKGAPKKHGDRFKLSKPARPADGAETLLLGSQTVRIQAWNGLHLKKLPKLIVMLLRVELLEAGGSALLQTAHVVTEDRANECPFAGIVPDVLVALCHLAHVPLSQTKPGPE